ncbi:hypothetical protein OS188_10600 [Xanthomarina sp. F1114]|nr:hypothetical protein [Xanthomarina sp. F1114]MCX7548399.1 hypothetical protein [Xanthomarina sp. F1114]
MKSKKYLIAIAIFGGMLFTAQAENFFQSDEDAPQIEKSRIKVPRHV